MSTSASLNSRRNITATASASPRRFVIARFRPLGVASLNVAQGATLAFTAIRRIRRIVRIPLSLRDPGPLLATHADSFRTAVNSAQAHPG